MFRYLFSIYLMLLSVAAIGQIELRHSFTHYNRDAGLVSNQVNSIRQDSTGYIWIATNDGLSRFDGIRYKTFRHDDRDSLSIPSNHVLQLLVDRDKNLWLLMTNGKAGIFNVQDFTYHAATVKPHDEWSMRSLEKKLIADEYGNLMLLLSQNELLTYNRQHNEFSPSNNFISFPEDWKVIDIAQQPRTHKYWIGLQTEGFGIYDQTTQQLSYAGNNKQNLRVVEQIKSPPRVGEFLFDKRDRVWFVSFDGKYSYLYSYDLLHDTTLVYKRDFVDAYKSYYEINGLLEQQDSTVWFRGFKTFGTYLEKQKDFEIIPAGSIHEKGIDYRFISALTEDRDKNIWIATGNNGIFRFNPSQEFFSNVAHISRQTGETGDGNPMSFYRDKDGTLLVGIWNDGLFRYDSTFAIVPLRITGIGEDNLIFVYDMFPSIDEQHVWFASQPGIYLYNTQNRFVTYFNPPILENKPVREIAEDKHGNLWLGLYRFGVFKWDKTKGKDNFDEGMSRYDAIPPVQIQNIAVDKRGYVWIATRTSGMYVIDPDNDKIILHFNSKAVKDENIADEQATAAMDYNDSLMVIASSNRLFFYNWNQKKLTPIQSEIASGEISSMQKDKDGNLWLGTTGGIYKIVPHSQVSVMFDRNNGIINDYFNISASYQLPGNIMAFGSSGHIVAFNTEEIKLNATIPNITLTSFYLMNRSLPVDSLLKLKEVHLGPVDNSITIDFSTLVYNDSYLVFYQLEGLDKQFRQADLTGQLIYSYLPPGNYTLRFKTMNSEGVIKENQFKLHIRVSPHFWQTWWFFSMLFLALAGIVYWYDRQKTMRIKKEQQMRVSIADNLHEDINTTLQNINVLSEIAAMKSGTQPEQAREYLKDIQRKSRSMVVAMNDMLWSINPLNDSMDKTVERLHEITEEVKNNSGTEIQVQVSGAVSSIKLDMKTRLEVISVYKMMLDLLINKSGAEETLVQLDCERNILLIKIFSRNIALRWNDGVSEKYLREINAKTEEINATLNVDSDGHGTDFILRVNL